mmetsp:Transcript_106017/g.304668  ORF Transcript_106017/g.304668 Transcript_106017/m.304668 type:complete len:344 (+) Transcript_106017:2090-3121(+)
MGHMSILQDFQLLIVFRLGLAKDTLQVIDPLLKRRVMQVACLFLVCQQAPHMLLVSAFVFGCPTLKAADLRVCVSKLALVPVNHTGQSCLHLLDLGPRSSMLRVPGLHITGHAAVHGLDRIHLPCVPVVMVCHCPVQVLELRVHLLLLLQQLRLLAREGRVGLLDIADGADTALVRRHPAMQLVKLRVRLRELPSLRRGGFVQEALQVLQALGKRAVERAEAGLFPGEARVRFLEAVDGDAMSLTRGEPAMHLLQLRMRNRQLLRVLVGRVPKQLLQEVQALRHCRMVAVPLLAFGGQLGVRRLQRFDLLEVLVCVAAQQALQIVKPFPRGRMVGIRSCLLVV